MDDEQINNLNAAEKTFDDGSIFTFDTKKVLEVIKVLNTTSQANNIRRESSVMKTITAVGLLNQRHIERIEARNAKLTWLIIALTVVSIALSILTFVCR